MPQIHLPIRLEYHEMYGQGKSWRTVIVNARWFRSEISWIPSQAWHRPRLMEYGPYWHEMDLGRFTIDISIEDAYDDEEWEYEES